MGRLTKNKEFRRVYKQGRAYVGRYMVLYVLPRCNDVTRIGFTVGKKVGGAVQRNRVRRRLKEAYRLLQPEIRMGYDLVLVARTRALTVQFKTISEEMRGLFGQAKLLISKEEPSDA